MATLNDRVLDNGLTVLDTEANRVDICSSEPTTYAAATSTLTLGNETSISISAPADASPNGRKVTLAAITGASVTGTGFEFARADVTSSHKRWFGWVIQVVQHHHRRVLRATQRIELEVVSLTQRKKRLSRIEKLGLHGFVLFLFDFLFFHGRQRRALLAHQLASA